MKRYLIIALFALTCVPGFCQSDLVVGSAYQFNLQRQGDHGDAFLLHNSQFSSSYQTLSWKTTHGSFGSRGLRFSYTDGIHFFADGQPSTAGATFTPTTRFFIGNSGNVGVGTSTPRGKFDVDGAGDIYLADDVNAGTGQSMFLPGHIYIAPYNGGNVSYLQARRLNDSGSTSLQLRTMNNGTITEAMTIQHTGMVGIGIGTIVNPQTKLHVYESGSSTSTWRGRVVASGANKSIVMGEYNGMALFGAHNFNLDGWSDLVMQIGGNTGIGHESPTQKLTVKGNILQESENSALGIDAQSNARFGIIKQYGSYPSIASDNASPIIFSQTNQTGIFTNISGATLTERMRIAVNGNVGIGTKSPDQKLTVKGKIHAEEVIIDTSVPVPDYVFEKSYDLKSLDEVKKYIDENKHLPEVPSAKEMEKDGVKVGEMEMILLKKIEELTLYIIELKAEKDSERTELLKKIESLEKAIEPLKK